MLCSNLQCNFVVTSEILVMCAATTNLSKATSPLVPSTGLVTDQPPATSHFMIVLVVTVCILLLLIVLLCSTLIVILLLKRKKHKEQDSSVNKDRG